MIRDRDPALRTAGASSVELMNLMGYDAMALGEGDLSQLGVTGIRQRLQGAEFAFLSANAVLTGTDELVVQPYVVLPVAGLRVAVIGITGIAAVPGVEIRDPLTVVPEVIEQLQGEAEVIVLLSHAGLETNRAIAAQVPGIDLIISGGGRAMTQQPERTDDGPLIVHADVSTTGHAGRYIGVGLWSLDPQGEMQEQEWQRVGLTPDVPDDPELLTWVRQNP